MGRVVLDHVTKRFDGITAVDDLSLTVDDEEFLVLLGPSGCGKSTALRMIAGLERPTDGTITIGDRVVNDVEPKDRDIAMVFQTYALYPHMTVRRNIEFPLRSRHVDADERGTLVADAADSLGLGELLDRKPAQLSGGQRQRVALARAIVRRPQAFLMDEPLSNLDAKLRVQTRAELVELQRRLPATIVYVTHDQVEAMTMGHRIAMLEAGVLQQVGPPQEVYARPANLFVARFIGSPPMNTVEGRLGRVGERRRRGAARRAGAAHAALAQAVQGTDARQRSWSASGPSTFDSGASGGVDRDGDRRRVARARAPRRVPARRRPDRHRAPARAGRRPAARRIGPARRRAGGVASLRPRIGEPDRRAVTVEAVRDDRVLSRRTKWKERGLAYLMLLPALVVFAVFIFYPLIQNV